MCRVTPCLRPSTRITCSGCVAHGLDLYMEDLAKAPWAEPSFTLARELVASVVSGYGEFS